jgi:hypothetical protein
VGRYIGTDDAVQLVFYGFEILEASGDPRQGLGKD